MLSVSGRSIWGIGAAISGLIVLGYCVYFDHQRRNDPNFKKNLREKRKQRRVAKALGGSNLPDLRDTEAVQRYFLSEVELGEDFLRQGEVDTAIEHLGSAIAVCGHPQQLLQILSQSLPQQVFHSLLERLPQIGQAIQAKQEAVYGPNPFKEGIGGGLMPSGPTISTQRDFSASITVDDELE